MYTGRSCWLCGRNGTAEPLDKHHIFGGAYRKKSEKYGLTVYLCHGSCHIFGEKAVHSCRETMDELHRYGKKMAMERMGWTKEDFMREFGRNYLDEEDLRTSKELDRIAKFEELPYEKRKVAEYQKAYREANREKVAAQKKAYREANREKAAEGEKEK